MIVDHTRSTDQLVALGGMRKASLQAKMKPGADGKYVANGLIDSDHAIELNSLNSKSDGDFDRTYIHDQVEGHEAMVSLLRAYSQNGDNARLKAFATEILPTVRIHLSQAQSIEKLLLGR
jgi:putative membrane protein